MYWIALSVLHALFGSVISPQCWTFTAERGDPPPPVMLLDGGSVRFLRPFITVSMSWSMSTDTLRIFTERRWPWSEDIYIEGALREEASGMLIHRSDVEPIRLPGQPDDRRVPLRAFKIDCASLQWPAQEQLVYIDPEEDWRRRARRPVDQPPRLENAQALQDSLYRRWPSRYRNDRIGGVVLIRFWIDETGIAFRARVEESSGHPTLDSLALDVANVVDFSPAIRDGRSVEGSAAVPFRFAPR
jgi:TonB family protein